MSSQALHSKPFDLVLKLWLFSVFIFTILGNAASDMWLTGTAVIFLIVSFVEKDWSWLRQRWLQIALLFWLWILVASLASQWPENALKDSLTWIRFPLFAVALPFLLNRKPDNRRVFLGALLAGLAILVAVLLWEKINNPDAQRLYGTWGRDMNPKSGWFVVGFGLPISLWALCKITDRKKAALWAIPLAVCISLAAILTGEIYMTLSLLLGIGLFLLISRMSIKLLASLAALLVAGSFFVMQFLPSLAERFSNSLTTRLPWLSSSDYHIPWMRGLEVAKLNPLFGVGPRGYGPYCKQSADLQALFDAGCFHHPHQLYIQIAAETGLIGLVLFVALLFALLLYIVRGNAWRKLPVNVTAALCLVITALWPISTYSNGFGQHRNFFTWLIIAFALALSREWPQWRLLNASEPSTGDTH